MAGFTQTEQQATLDARFPTSGATDYVAYSADGSTETTALARTAVGATGWAAATAATPSVKANAGTLTTADATGAVTVSHFAIFTASTSGTQRTDWTALTASKTLATGDNLKFVAGDLRVTLD